MNKYAILETVFGYSSFRNNQEEIIDSLIANKDTIAIMATGGGKSLCFQIPSLLNDGITIVITPLIALMENQVDELKKRRIKAVFINSEQDFFEQKVVIQKLKDNFFKFLYISPEKLENHDFVAFLKELEISYLIIDEAHCVSVWGNDFRLSYRLIKGFLEGMKKRPTVGAFTATADKYVLNDIVNLIGLKEYNLFKSTFDRPNLFYGTYMLKNRFDFLVKYLLKQGQTAGIIYVLTRKKTDELHQKLLSLGFKVVKYHGGLEPNEKSLNQNDFMTGKANLICATSAFGMGINKPDIRFVINYDLPLTMEDLVQQSGRCSRDGKAGECLLFFSQEAIQTCEYFIRQTRAVTKEETKELIKYKYQKLRKVIEYSQTNKCLHQYIVNYFGEINHLLCANCSNCQKKKQKRQRLAYIR